MMMLFFAVILGTFWTTAFAASTCIVSVEERTPCANFWQAFNSSTSLITGREEEQLTIYAADSCLAAGCCWMRSHDSTHAKSDCYAPISDVQLGYSLSGLTATETGFEGRLTLLGTGTTAFGKDIPELTLQMVYHSEDILEVKITDANDSHRWEIPETVIPRHTPWTLPPAKNESFSHFTVEYTTSPFTLTITRKAGNEVIFAMDSSFIFKDQYLEFSLLSNNHHRNTYGFGESTRLHQALKVPSLLTLWAADVPAMIMSENLYGSYPYYLQQVTDSASPNLGAAHGGLFLNSNGMDVAILEDRITVRAIGGVFDFFVFSGRTAKEVIAQSTVVIGKPAMIPYWTLGFHNCRWGYQSIEEVIETVNNYSKAGIPLDTQWFDIDYMDGYRDFTVNASTFPLDKVQAFMKQLHDNGQHFVPILDPGVKVDFSGSYEAFNEGMALDLFIKDYTGKDYYNGQVWPGVTYFPDFFHPAAQDYWTKQLQSLYEMIDYDGIWIDMNEISNFCNKEGIGQVCYNSNPSSCQEMTTSCCLDCVTLDSTNSLDFPPYHINNLYGRLGARTIAMSSKLANNVSVYDSHNLYGLLEQIATHQAITNIRQKRPFVLSRSSFLSTGRVATKWTGDNVASWHALQSSLISLMDFNLFSVPMIGSDICGFYLDTSEELCARWIAVGAFYPFSRDHNGNGWLPQELYRWESVTAVGKKALAMRYQLLPYYYSLFYESHSRGLPVIQSLWMNYPQDLNCSHINTQFMVGEAVLVSPVLERGRREVEAYFPQGLWYDFQKQSLAFDHSTKGGEGKKLVTPLEEVNLHIRGGYVLPLQQPAMTTTAGRKTPFTYLVALDEKGEAKGSLFWDDGEQIELDSFLRLEMTASLTNSGESDINITSGNRERGWFRVKVIEQKDWTDDQYKLGSVVILSREMARPFKVTINGETLANDHWQFDVLRQSLTVTLSPSLPIQTELSLQWW